MKSSLVFKLSSPFRRLLPVSLLRRLTQQGLIIPFYHTVSDKYLPHVYHLYHYKNIKQFEADLDWLCKSFTPVSINDIYLHVQKKKDLPKNAFHLTFDDGLKECADIIAPILKKRNLPATFFINSAFIDNQSLMFRYKISLLIEKITSNEAYIPTLLSKLGLSSTDSMLSYIRSLNYHQTERIDQIANWLEVDFSDFLSKNSPYMSYSDIQKLVDLGFHIGSHSIDHPHYYTLNLEQQINQTIQAHRHIKKQVDQSLNAFAFPFTDAHVSSSFFHHIHQKEGMDLSFGGAGLKKEKINFHLQRVAGEDKIFRPLEQIVKNEYLYYMIKAFVGKNTIHRHHE